MNQYILPFDCIRCNRDQEFGGKGANLGELKNAGFNVPPGFCISGKAYQYLIQANELKERINENSTRIDFNNFGDTEKRTAIIRSMIEKAKLPEDLKNEIVASYRNLEDRKEIMSVVAVRSSVAVTGSKISSFPGMMDTFHYIRGEDNVLVHIKKCWASLWTTRAAMTRFKKKIDHNLGIIAPIVQKMVDSDIAGVIFLANPITNNRNEIFIEANWGIGESVVSGKTMNDLYILDKSSLKIKEKRIANKNKVVCFDEEKGFGRKEMNIKKEKADIQTLTNDQLVELAHIGSKIEKLFGYPQDIEWAYEKGKLYILQSRNIKGLK